MKKIARIFVYLIFAVELYAQVDLAAGMGISYINNSSLKDYININFIQPGDELSTFNSSVEFFGEADFTVFNNFQLGIDYSVSIYSYNTSNGKAGFYDLSYLHHKPTLVAYYVIPGEGYKFKFGGGVGLRFVSLDEKISSSPSTINYSSTGVGFLVKAQGHTLLGGNFYANIGLDARVDLPGEPENGGKALGENASSGKVNINSISVGIKVGISYLF